MPPKLPPAQRADRAALDSIDALHAADPATLSPEVRRLQRLVKVRRALYYSVLAPFGWLSRTAAGWLVPLSALVALVGFGVAVAVGGAPLLAAALGYWAVGGVAYFAISMRMAALLDDAAAAAGLDPAAVIARWASDG